MEIGNISFKNKCVLVTGSNSGMGAEMSIAFARLGAKVVIQGRNDATIEEIAIKCQAASPNKFPPLKVKADVSKDEDCKRLIDTVIKAYGQLDILVNNAGVMHISPIDDPELMKKFDEQMAVNVRAPLLLSSLCAPHLAKTKGNIVNISSGIGMKAFPKAVGYSTSKWAIMMITECLALELGENLVRVNTVNPGYVENPSWHQRAGYGDAHGPVLKKANPMKKNAEILDVVNAVLFIASDAATHINGVALPVDGGMTKTVKGTGK
uniref:Uncharacterized protein n=1 Tax=Strigamia maritima TaxID=126957 RepID=T1J8K6_STRMM